MARRRSLDIVYDEIGARAGALVTARGDWPCRRGCADCCRSLAAVPMATRPEWERMWTGYLALPAETRGLIRARVQTLAAQTSGPYVCPMLDDAAGACLVYQHRPAACRSYGFYAARDGGRWCHRIEAIATSERDLIFGNHEAIERDLQDLGGAPLELPAWFAAHQDKP
jgi:Fe-S-cluster containining protein